MLAGLLLLSVPSAASAEPPLRAVADVPLPGVTGRIDHMALDPAGRRLFVAALGNNTLEVVDLREGKRTRSVTGFEEPQGLAFARGSNRLAVANGGDGSCVALDGESLDRVATIDLGDDADNVRYDAATGRLFVGHGEGAIAILDAGFRRIGDVPVGGHPESFQLEADGRRMFVNVPSAREVAVVDLERRAVVGRWTLRDAADNFPMALDEARARLWIGCRKPSRLVGIDTRSGRAVASLHVDGDPDDVFVDARRGRVYVACGAGFVDVFGDEGSGAYRSIARVPTAAGARTALFAPETGRLYVAAPRREGRDAFVRIFEAPPAGR